MNQSLNFIRANRSKSGRCDDSGLWNRSINSRSIREYWYPLVEVLTVVVEVVVNSISTDSISKSLIWTTEERNRINERELGKARIPHSDASPLSHITDSMYLCLTLVTRRKTSFSISLTGSKRTIFVIPFINMTLSTLLILAKCRTSVIHELRNGPRSTYSLCGSVVKCYPKTSFLLGNQDEEIISWKLWTFTRIRNSKTKRNKRNDRNDQYKTTKTERPKRPKKYTKKLIMIKLNSQGCQALAVIFVSFRLCGLLLIYLTRKFSYLSIAISLACGRRGTLIKTKSIVTDINVVNEYRNLFAPLLFVPSCESST